MTSARRATRRPFTVVCCERCCGEPKLMVTNALKESIRRCAHGMLVSSACLRGPLACAARPHGPGATVVLQPCALDRQPDGPARWIGPIRDEDDVRIVRDWLERGEWDCHALPERMRIVRPDAAGSRRN